MRTASYYKVKPSVAVRAGVASARYRTDDGMMIVNEQDVRMIRLTPEEYLTGVVEAVLTEEEAKMLIAKGGHKLGVPAVEEPVTGEEADTEEVAEAVVGTTSDTDGQTPAEEMNEDNDVEPIEEEVTNE